MERSGISPCRPIRARPYARCALIRSSGSVAANSADPNPDAYTELLSLSIRDGLRVGGFQLWPLLAALQVILLVVVVGVFSARRVLQAANLPGN